MEETRYHQAMLQAERFDLSENAEYGGAVLEQPGEHGLAALQLARHRGEGRQGRDTKPTPYPDRVQARRCVHRISLQRALVSPQRRNLVIVRATALARRLGRFRSGRWIRAAARVLD